jgi:hypothetical protein
MAEPQVVMNQEDECAGGRLLTGIAAAPDYKFCADPRIKSGRETIPSGIDWTTMIFDERRNGANTKGQLT